MRAQVLANISKTRAGSLASNVGEHFLAEGRVQEALNLWPPNRGAWGPISEVTLDVGTQIDRFGPLNGSFVSPVGTTFGQRALPSTFHNRPYNAFELIKPIPNVQSSLAAPWFGKQGYGVQFDVPNNLNYYLQNGYLKSLSVPKPPR
jgi:filamentous hemagglutinin